MMRFQKILCVSASWHGSKAGAGWDTFVWSRQSGRPGRPGQSVRSVCLVRSVRSVRSARSVCSAGSGPVSPVRSAGSVYLARSVRLSDHGHPAGQGSPGRPASRSVRPVTVSSCTWRPSAYVYAKNILTYIHMYVCVYVCMCIYIYTHTCIHVYVCMRICTYAYDSYVYKQARYFVGVGKKIKQPASVHHLTSLKICKVPTFRKRA